MGRRKKTSPAIEARVLTQSRRRCALCVGLDGDFSQKIGQIDHLDGDPSNDCFENLVFLCLEHHAQKSSKSTQSKGFTNLEIREYRDRLYRRLGTTTDDPSNRIMVSWKGLKASFRALGARHDLNVDGTSFRVAASDFEQASVITKHLADTILALRDLRNSACFEFDPTAQAVYEQRFIEGADELAATLDKL